MLNRSSEPSADIEPSDENQLEIAPTNKNKLSNPFFGGTVYLNPFGKLADKKNRKTNRYYNQIWHDSFFTRMRDTFHVFAGFNRIEDVDVNQRFGLFDALLFPLITQALFKSSVFLMLKENIIAKTLGILSLVITVPLYIATHIVRFTVAAALTLATTPFIGMMQGIAAIKRAIWRHRVNNIEVTDSENKPSTYKAISKNLTLWHKIKIDPLEKKGAEFIIYNTSNQKNEHVYEVDLTTKQNSRKFKSLFRLGFCNPEDRYTKEKLKIVRKKRS